MRSRPSRQAFGRRVEGRFGDEDDGERSRPSSTSPGDVLKVGLEHGAIEKTLIVPKAWTKEAFRLEVSKDTHDYFATDIGIPQSESDTASERGTDKETPTEAAEALVSSAESRFNLWFAWGIALYECE